MKVKARTVLAVATFLLGGLAHGQDFTPATPPQPSSPPPPASQQTGTQSAPQQVPPPPPQYSPPPPPPPPPQQYQAPPPQYYYYYGPPPPVYYQPPPPRGDGKTHFTIRASGGVGFLSSGYYCGYYYTYYYVSYSCGAGYATAQPDINLDVDVWVEPTLALSFGANVMWGSYTPYITGVPASAIYSTTWEPHVDILTSPPYSSESVKGRVRLGFGLYITEANGYNTTGQHIQYNAVGGAFRLGFGASFLPKSKVGIGIDTIFEAGWVGSSYVSTIQLLIGPELHF